MQAPAPLDGMLDVSRHELDQSPNDGNFDALREKVARFVLDLQKTSPASVDLPLQSGAGALGKPPPADLAAALKQLRAPRRGCKMLKPEKTPTPNRGVPNAENRAYVPTATGNGLRYDWSMTVATTRAQLEQQVADQEAIGFRLTYLTTPHRVTGEDSVGVFVALWTKDDDCAFRSGLEIVSPDQLQQTLDTLRERGRRPLCVTHSHTLEPYGDYYIVWIQDNKYRAKGDWELIHIEHADVETQLAPWVVQNYRVIWATSHSRLTLLLVRDQHALGFFIYVNESSSPKDAVEAARVAHPTMVPICLECKPVDVENDDGDLQYLHRCTIILALDPDTTEQVANDYFVDADTVVNWPARAQQSKVLQRRITAIALLPDINVPPTDTPTMCVVVEVPVPVPRFRCISREPDIPLSDVQRAAIDAAVLAYMNTAQASSLTVAIRDVGGWRLRTGYTNAPYQHEDTYPDSQFRVGSVSKMITGFAAWRLMEELGANLTLDTKIFGSPLWEADLTPTVDGTPGYAAGVLNVRVRHLLQHTAGWDRATFAPGTNPGVVLPAVRSGGDPVGWATSTTSLYPMFARDILYYCLNRSAFLVSSRYAPPNAAGLPAATGWRADWSVMYDPDNVNVRSSLYSNFHADLLGHCIERFTEVVTDPLTDYSGYGDWARKSLLDPVGASLTVPAATDRPGARVNEVCYPSAFYLEISNAAAAACFPSILWGIVGGGNSGDAFDVYLADLKPTPEPLFDTPPVVPWAYGAAALGAAANQRLENVLPSGGWVSTAPDLCRIIGALASGQSSPFSAASINQMRFTGGLPPALPAGSDAVTLSALFANVTNQRTLPHHNGYASGGFSWVNLNLNEERAVAFCCAQQPFSTMQWLSGAIDAFL